jgi:hypothetical protein
VIKLDAGVLSLAGTFLVSDIGIIERSGGTVDISGTLNNAGTELVLDVATGSWRLGGGTVLGGKVTASGGAKLIASNSGGTLNAVTLNADLDLPVAAAFSAGRRRCPDQGPCCLATSPRPRCD